MAYPAVLWFSVLAALLGAFQFGYHLGVLNTCLDWMALDLGFDVTKEGSIVVSAALIGASVGALVAGSFADRVGPGRALLINNVLLLTGSTLCALSPGGLWAAIVGRVLAGMGAGAASLYVPRYLAEISPSTIRGAISSLNQAFICLGILAAYVVGLPYINDKPAAIQIGGRVFGWWRVMLAFGILPAATQVLAMAVLPESPMWLRWKGSRGKAEAAEKRLLGGGWQADESSPAAPLVEQAAQSEGELEAPVAGKGWSELLKPRYRWIMLLTTLLPLFQQLSGINTCILYSSQVFREAGLRSPVLGSIVMGLINLGGTLLAVAYMDRAGRRLLLILSYAGMGTCLLLIAIVDFVPGTKQAQAIVAFVALLVFVLFFGLGAGPIPWVYLPEVLPSEIKGAGASVGTSLNWISTFLVGLSFPLMLRVLGVGGSYLVYAVFNFVALAFAYVYMVETKRRSLADIQRLLLVE